MTRRSDLEAEEAMMLPKTRWIPPLTLLAASLLLWAGCDGETPTPREGPMDNTSAAGLSLYEREIRAAVDDGACTVTLRLHKRGGGSVDGRAALDLLQASDGAVLASARLPFTAEGETTDLAVPLAFAQGPDEGPVDLAAYTLRYRLTWGDEAIWGRRSLYAALPKHEVQLLSTDRFQADVPAHLRVLSRDPTTGESLAGVPVTVRFERDELSRELYSGTTDDFGTLIARVEAAEELVGQGSLVVEVDTPGVQEVLRADVAVERSAKVLLTTDKPLYQPGQTMHLRALALRRPNLIPEAGEDLTFEVFDGKDNKVERVTVQTDDYGIASTTFRLAREVNMGTYRIVATLHDVETEKTVTVDRYSLPRFDIDLELDREIYLAGSSLQGTLKVIYFFGEPVRGGSVDVVASTLDAGESVFFEHHAVTNDDGLLRFDLDLPDYVVGLPLEQGGGLVNLQITVADTAGQSRTINKTIRIARALLEAVVVPESGELVPGLVNELLVRTRDAAGNPVPCRGTLSVTGGDTYEFDTDANGMASVSVPVQSETLVATLVVVDSGGNEVTEELSFAAGSLDGAVLLRTDRSLYRVGDTMAVDVATVGAPDRVYLDVIRAGQTVLTEILEPDERGEARYELDLASDHSGALQVEAYYLALGSSIRRDGKLVYVAPADGLSIDIQADAEVYRPGEEATLQVAVTDAQGVGQAAAVGLQAVDEAVFGLVEFRPGLERTYFQIEAELGEPRYQIGVPSLSAIAGDVDAPDDPAAQEEADLLFAATDPATAYPVSINTHAQAQVQVITVVQPLVEAAAQEWLTALGEAAAEGWVTEENLDEKVQAGFGRSYDPWGKPLKGAVAGERTLEIRSSGPDEIAATADDVVLGYDVRAVLYGIDKGGNGRDDELDDDWDWADAEGEAPMAGGEGGAQDGHNEEPPSADPDDSGNGGAAPRVRRHFPETLFVEPALITDGTGHAELTLPLADSITTWRLSALANSLGGLLGSTDAGIRVFQDFFVDIDFPATLTRGDEFSVPIALYNYLDEPQSVRVEVQPAEWLTLLGPSVVQVDLAPGEVQGLRVPVRVDLVGLHELTVFAYGDRLQDAVARTVLVEPDGHEVRTSSTGRLEGTVSRTVRFPESAVEGSPKLLVKLYPGLMSQVIEGLDGVLRMPSGCFEQTSSSTWPNVQVARYMRESGQISPEIDLQAMEYINTGYQRLLTFECDGGGFEWFGQTPAHTVLTAYGLLEFADMAAVRPVDEAMIARTRAWLLSKQNGDGSWEVEGRGYDEAGQLTDKVAVTAYVAFGLAAAGEDSAAMDRARSFLELQVDSMGPYALSLFANFMVAYAPDAPLTGSLLDRLAELVESSLDAAQAHWETDEQTTTYGRGEGAWIETTALATHALLAAGAHTGVAQEAVDWLVTKKDSHGAWGSTAGTVWTIKCLLKAMGGRDEEADATVSVLLDGQEQATFTVTPDNSDVMRQADLSELVAAGSEHLVEVVMAGEGNLQYGVVLAYHEPWEEAPPQDGPLSISVEYDRTQLEVDDTVTVTVEISNTDQAYADMVMVDLGIPPGFELVTDDLEQLEAQGIFSKYEFTERQLLLYFTVIAPGEPVRFSYRIIARDPIRAQAPANRVYSYYNEEVGAQTEPTEFEVE